MPDNVYTFKDLSFKVEGVGLCVSSLRILLRENGIPCVRVMVDPIHTPDQPTDKATAANIDLLAAANAKMQQWAVNRAVANLSFSVFKLDNLDQTITLKGWVVTGAGSSTVSASGSFAFELEISHPFFLIDSVNLNINPLSNMMTWDKSGIGSDNMITTIVEAMRALAAASVADEFVPDQTMCDMSDVEPMSPSESVQAILDRISKGADTLAARLEWDEAFTKKYGYDAWPLLDCLSAIETQGIDPASILSEIVVSTMEGLNEQTLWDYLSRYICDEFNVSILPTFWKDKLSLVPTSQWVSPTLTIPDSDVSDLKMPGVDPNPVAGTMTSIQDTGSLGDYTFFVPGASQYARSVITVPYLLPNITTGRIIMLKVPGFIEDYPRKAAALADGSVKINQQEEDGTLSTPANADFSYSPEATSGDTFEIIPDVMWSLMWVAAYNYFLTKFRAGVDITLSCRLLFKVTSDGDVHDGWLIPGKVCRVKTAPAVAGGAGESSDRLFSPGLSGAGGGVNPYGDGGSSNNPAPAEASAEGKGLYEFYITQVDHVIDFDKSQAGTVVTGCYVRPAANAGAGGETSPDPGRIFSPGLAEAGGGVNPYGDGGSNSNAGIAGAAAASGKGFSDIVKSGTVNPYYGGSSAGGGAGSGSGSGSGSNATPKTSPAAAAEAAAPPKTGYNYELGAALAADLGGGATEVSR